MDTRMDVQMLGYKLPEGHVVILLFVLPAKHSGT